MILIMHTTLFAQEGGDKQAGNQARIVMDPVFKITLKPKSVEYTFDTKEKYDQGIFEAQATQVEVEANMEWQITISAGEDRFEGDLGNSLNPGVFNYAKTGETMQALAYQGNSAPVATGAAGKRKAPGNTFFVDYYVNPGYEAPDTYQITLVYTISAK